MNFHPWLLRRHSLNFPPSYQFCYLERLVRSLFYLRYNKTVIDCVAWNKYPKDDTLVCTGEMSGVVKLKNINMYGNYIQPFTTKSPPQTLTFCNSSPCLFVGCKSGVVYQYDYRASRYSSFFGSNNFFAQIFPYFEL